MKPRPYWHVDLKWICGLIAFAAVSTALFFHGLATVTAREPAVQISTTVVAGLFSRDGLDDEKGVADLKQKAALAPTDTFTPIEQFPNVTLTKQQIATLSPKELRLAIFRQITEPIYDEGLAEAAKRFTPDPAKQQSFIKDATLLGLVTKKTNQLFKRLATYATVVALIFLAATVYFSTGWGRLVSPGFILVTASPLGTFVGLLLKNPPRDGNSPFPSLSPDVTATIGNSLNNSYRNALLAGFALLIAAAVGKLVQTVLHGRANHDAADAPTEPAPRLDKRNRNQ